MSYRCSTFMLSGHLCLHFVRIFLVALLMLPPYLGCDTRKHMRVRDKSLHRQAWHCNLAHRHYAGGLVQCNNCPSLLRAIVRSCVQDRLGIAHARGHSFAYLNRQVIFIG
ncbi:hypothetical protein F5Y12DRAFT_780145 [Xylaria sp. FL1777]|nr:hypothetical protein F5Y12DRAFT_780145 [Xylaria sp. FL1777]